MELKEGGGFLRKSEELPEQNFTIKASAKAFSILSNQLYTNKARAIIRELSCNAIDAQVAAGNKSKKFDLQLPNQTDQTFRLRDYGTGISPEDIVSVYTKYFESTKTTSNEYIGALGLGSKTPFCYTDNFQVASYYNGKKYSYAAFINDEGMPCVSLVSEDDTKEPNGLEVSFAVQQKDHATFKLEAEHVLFWFKPETRPNVTGQKINIAKLETALMGEVLTTVETFSEKARVSWKTVKIPQGWNGPGIGPHVIMGSVAYKVDRSTFAQLDAAQQAALSLNLHIEVPIGAVEVQASREALSLNKSTILFVKRTLSAIAMEARKSYEKELEQCATFWDACIYRYEKIAHLDRELRAIVEASPLEYKGQVLVRNIRNEQPGTNGIKSFLVFNRDVSQQTGEAVSKKDWDNDIEPRRNVAFVVVPKEWKEAKLRAWCRRNDKGFTKVVVLEDEAAVKKNNISKDYSFNYSDLPEPTRDKNGRQGLSGKKKDQIYTFDFKDKFARAFTDLVSIDFEKDGGVYVKAKFKKPYIGNNETTLTILANAIGLYNNLSKQGQITQIYGLTETQIKEIEDNDEWVELSSVITEFAQEKLVDPSLVDFAKANKLTQLTNQSILARVNNPVFSELKSQLATHPINEFFEVLQSHNSKAKNLRGKYESVDKFLRDHCVNRVVDGLATKVQVLVDAPAQVEYTKELLNLQTKEQALFDKYPVLMLFATPRSAKHSHAQVAKVLSQSF